MCQSVQELRAQGEIVSEDFGHLSTLCLNSVLFVQKGMPYNAITMCTSMYIECCRTRRKARTSQ